MCYALQFEDTYKWFRWHMVPTTKENKNPIRITDELIRERRFVFAPGTPDSFIEYRTLVESTGKELCKYSIFIMHAVAFLWEGYTWLLTAPSGTGKTTQYLNWKNLYPDEVSIICGDIPVLKEEKNQIVYVYPSPWNGKERIGFENHESYPLGGIIYLVQSDHNKMEIANFRELVLPLWCQFVGLPDTEFQIRLKEHFANLLFSRYPIWKFENRGDISSTILMHDNLFKSVLEMKNFQS